MSGQKKEKYYNDMSKADFVSQIEKRIKKEARQNNFFSKSDILLIKNPFIESVVKEIVGGLPITIVYSGNHIKEVTDDCLDDEMRVFLGKMFKGEEIKKIHDPKIIKIFRTVKSYELEKYAKAKGFEYVPKKTNEIDKIIQSLEKKHKETMFAMLKTMDEIDEALKK